MISKRILAVILTVCIVSMSFSSLVSVNAQTKDDQSSIQTVDECLPIENEQNDQNGQDGSITISSKYEFKSFMTNMTKSAYLGDDVVVKLACDIDMQGAVFDGRETFNGEFDGCGHTISNLSFKYFVKTNSGKISNIKFKNGTLINDKDIQGGFVVNNEEKGKIDNCVIDINSEDATIQAGFVYENKGTITNSETTLSVKGEKDNVGGFAEQNNGTIENCTATGVVIGNNFVGGFVGHNNGTIKNCIAKGDVTGNDYVGGFVGRNDGTIGVIDAKEEEKNCKAIGNVNGKNYAGEFAGVNGSNKTITGVAMGIVSGTGSNVGGFAGLNEEGGTITNLTKEFVINSADDFSEFIENSDEKENFCNYWKGNYKITLTCKIDMGNKTFKPTEEFNGSFHGNGYAIENLKIQSSSSRNKNLELAFIKTLGSDATFRNVTFNNYTIEDSSNVKDITYQAAGFVLNNYGTISDVEIYNFKMININHAKNGDAAGFVRINEKGGKISNCSVYKSEEKSFSDIFKKSNINAGFVSYNFGTISGTEDNNCSTNLPVNYGKNAGGFVSENFGTINWCTSEGEVTGKNCLGGFCGYNKGLLNNNGEGKINNCKSKGNVTANTSKSKVICGGFVGRNSGDIKYCHANDENSENDYINVTGGEYIGGFCGLNKEFGEIKACTSKNCNVKSSTWLSSIYCGGFVGANRGTITSIDEKDDKGNITKRQCEFSGEVNGCLDTEKLLAIGVSSAVAAALIVGVIYYVIAKHNSKSIAYDINNDADTIDDRDIMNYHNNFCDTVNSSLIIKGEQIIKKVNSSYRDSVFKKFKSSEILKAIALTIMVACIASVVTGVVIEETAKEAYVGGFCGYNYCKISGSKSESEVKAKTLYNKYTKCGGFVGTNGGVVEYCKAYGEGGENSKKGKINFKMYAGGYLGGFVGENISNIYDCESKINVKNGKYTGGFCGYNEGGISKSTSYCNAETNAKTSTNTTRCGGFVGYNKNGSIEGCKSQGNATGQEYVGGFCGDNVARIVGSISTGSAKTKAKIKITKCGGFVGENSGTIDYSNCDSEGNVEGQEYVGGFVGMNKKNINKCSCITESVKAKTETHNVYAGGFVGVNSDGTITECNATNSSKETNISKETRSVEAKSNSGQAKVGGFVGVNKAKIKKSNSTGHHIYLSAGVCYKDDGCGGFVGKNDEGSEVEIDDCKVGGIKDNKSNETKCIVETTNHGKGGGFVGEVKRDSKIKESSCETHRVVKDRKGKKLDKLEKREDFYYSYYKKMDKKELENELKKFVGCFIWNTSVDENDDSKQN